MMHLRSTGRNIHALDPYRMPSQAALERGTAVAKDILDSHKEFNGGAWPETVAVGAHGQNALIRPNFGSL
jgi:magnesium chelatase subunit H